MTTLRKEELMGLELIRLIIKRFNQNEISLQTLEDLRDSVIKNSEIFYGHKHAINEVNYFINKKYREAEESEKHS